MILAVNMVQAEDGQVVPFIRNNKYGFSPLKGGDRDWRKSVYAVRGTPTTFLIDGEGRIVFFDVRARNREEERTLELEIEALLARLPET